MADCARCSRRSTRPSPPSRRALEAARAQYLDDVYGTTGDAAVVATDIAASGARVDAALVNVIEAPLAPDLDAVLARLRATPTGP